MALPASGQDASKGRETAAALCASCHELDEKVRGDAHPIFAAIANLPSTTELSLKVFLRSNHNQMPNLIIPASETDDLVAYILGLRKPFRLITPK
jgi:mono/diheme cytochrome c family protein